ncbi:AEC family transporter [Rhizobium pusense]|uniref:Predicted permeases n=2 Tax=Agrobacterium TaxID=357 RepID=A0A9W5B432_9HYPH|nr:MULTISPECIES: AEC family transporter [Rhizobium/Agrobacterium group]MDH0912794.1 AEC family transporter [Agrobacterium pusense]MDH1099036.1 AEC family transporter [Agrobacterium pusense]MDH1115583.1 AEC family transporter [Agrobacterium pusense]MDH2197353.1 AEC family transporter [Agrobacterium pusense]OJH55771.1 permease [Agrobacterium pusense]
MIETVIGALLPIVVTLAVGFLAGWHHDFDAKQATILNRMVMLYALPLSLFAGMVGMDRTQILSQGPLALSILVGMAGAYGIVNLLCRYVFHRDTMTAALLALAISGPAVPFVGVTVLGHLFGTQSAVPISVASLVMNLIQVPLTLMLLSYGMASTRAAAVGGTTGTASQGLGDHIVHALKEPVVWAPLLALALIAMNIRFPAEIADSLNLLGRATGGVALFASGIVLFSRRVSISLPVVLAVAARNLVIPGMMLAGLMLLGAAPDLTRESVLTLAIPTASIAVILAVQYQTAEQEMASILFFSTILSVFTMGMFIWLTN